MTVPNQVVDLYHAVFDATATSAGTTLLDVGCGSGLAVQTAAGRGARVAGLDASPALLALARQRCPNADLRVGDLEELPYGDATFDVATSFNAVQYAADQHRALLELARVVRPGGQVAIATWGRPETCEITAVLAEVAPLMPPPPPGAAPGGPFALSAPGRPESVVEQAGLVPVGADEGRAP